MNCTIPRKESPHLKSEFLIPPKRMFEAESLATTTVDAKGTSNDEVSSGLDDDKRIYATNLQNSVNYLDLICSIILINKYRVFLSEYLNPSGTKSIDSFRKASFIWCSLHLLHADVISRLRGQESYKQRYRSMAERSASA